MMRRILVLTLCAVPLLAAGASRLSQDQVRDLLKVKIRTVQHMALNPTLIRAVREQNARNMSMEEIHKRDKEWSATSDVTDFKRSLEESQAGRFLTRHVQTGSSFNEAFLTDIHGANVAAYPPTSDYWQGDEKKWTAAFNGGEGRVFIGPVEFDQSTRKYAAQVSAPVIDRGRTIGVLVVGVTLNYLQNRQGGSGQ